MSNIKNLKNAKTKIDLAELLGVKASYLTYVLYVLKPQTQYESFEIPKKSGGVRVIEAPTDRLKLLQSRLSNLLQNCIQDINKERKREGVKLSSLSHGFVREKSIITNTMQHLNKKNVLNIDLKNFFGSFNFGRVRGFFIKNKNFELDPSVATVIAQIACNNNKLPQGSPCSPVITNLITHHLDIRLATLAKKYSCYYSRYADDITISTREKIFPPQIMNQESGIYIPGKRLENEINRAGFVINSEKTRILYCDSRQEVTGLVSNKKPSIKHEYWRSVRAQCHRLFKTGSFTKSDSDNKDEGTINELEGKLNFIDQIDYFNRNRQKPPLNPEYLKDKDARKKCSLLTGREKTFSRFLYYRWFYGNKKPTILTEGETDIIYLSSAIHRRSKEYPKLAKQEKNGYEPLVSFFKNNSRMEFLLGFRDGAGYFNSFMNSYPKNHAYYKSAKPKSPVIIVLDNDDGFSKVVNTLKKIKSTTPYPTALKKDQLKKADFIHVMENLYIVLTPLGPNGEDTCMEDLFDRKTLSKKISGKVFNRADKINNEKEFGKKIFAKSIVKPQRNNITFYKFKPLLKRIVKCIDHYESIR